jgi:hypothetical protein
MEKLKMKLEQAVACAKAKCASMVEVLQELSVETYYEDYDGTLEIVVKSKATNKEMFSVKVLCPVGDVALDDDTQYAVVQKTFHNNINTFTTDGVNWFR